MQEVEFADWPIEGPRTASWIIRELGKLSVDPNARHHTWKHENNLKEEQKLCSTHEMISDLLELALTYDQLDGSNVAVVEQACRYLQDIEQEVRRKNEAIKDFSVSQYYLGRHRKTGGALVAPALTAWSAAEASKESAILKEQRKAQEERKALRGK